MDGKMLSRLEAIEDHTERLKRVEDLLEDVAESNLRMAKALEEMLRFYQMSMAAQEQAQRYQGRI